jgi:hypothetical protein
MQIKTSWKQKKHLGKKFRENFDSWRGKK